MVSFALLMNVVALTVPILSSAMTMKHTMQPKLTSLPSCLRVMQTPRTIRREVSNELTTAMMPSLQLSTHRSFPTQLSEGSENEFDTSISLSETDQGIIGSVGCVTALIMMYSEYVLKTTGCGLPAGPAGIVGLSEGLSYLSVIAIVATSLFTKVRTGSGLPAGPGGVLGAAEGLSFLAVVVGIVVLASQILQYGYIPNAIPMEGGMCS
jgi:hypothetical protein